MHNLHICEKNSNFARAKSAFRNMTIKVLLEADCADCAATLNAVRDAVLTVGGAISVESVTDVKEILSYKVWRMPSVVIDGKVVSIGKNLDADSARQLIENYL